MKNLLLFTLLIGFTGTAQIETVEPDRGVLVGQSMNSPAAPQLRYWDTENGKRYVLFYQNQKYTITDIKSISFYATDEELEQLYLFLKAGFDERDIKSINVGEGRISRGKVGGQLMLFIYEKGRTDGQAFLNKKGLDRLFGKR